MHLFTDIQDMRDLDPDDAAGELERMRAEALERGGFVIFEEIGEDEMISCDAHFTFSGEDFLALTIGEEHYLFPWRGLDGSELEPLVDANSSQEGFAAVRVLNGESFEIIEAALDLSDPSEGSLRLRGERFCFATEDWHDAVFMAAQRAQAGELL